MRCRFQTPIKRVCAGFAIFRSTTSTLGRKDLPNKAMAAHAGIPPPSRCRLGPTCLLFLLCLPPSAVGQFFGLDGSDSYLLELGVYHGIDMNQSGVGVDTTQSGVGSVLAVRRCREFCVDLNITCHGVSDPLAAEEYRLGPCLQQCVGWAAGAAGETSGNTRECRSTHLRAAKIVENSNKDPTVTWHCAQVSLLGRKTAAASEYCGPAGCSSCSDECRRAAEPQNAVPREDLRSCLGGRQSQVPQGVGQHLHTHTHEGEAESHTHGMPAAQGARQPAANDTSGAGGDFFGLAATATDSPVANSVMCDKMLHDIASMLTDNFTRLSEARRDVAPMFTSSADIPYLNERIIQPFVRADDTCGAWKRAFDAGDCYCHALANDYLPHVFSRTLSELVKLAVEQIIPGICSFEPNFDTCPLDRASHAAAPEPDLGACLDTMTSSVRICASDAASSACCSAVADFDSNGCFCNTALPALKSLNDGVEGLLQLRDRCIALPSRYSHRVGCPLPTYDQCSRETGEPRSTRYSRMYGQVNKLGAEMFGVATKYHFNYNAVTDVVFGMFEDDAVVDIKDLGVYKSKERVLEYFVIAMDSYTAGMFGGFQADALLIHNWKFVPHKDGQLGATISMSNFDRVVVDGVPRLSAGLQIFNFSGCKTKVQNLYVNSQSTIPIAARMSDPRQQRYTCTDYFDSCAVPSMREYETTQACNQYFDSLPNISCPASAGKASEGNSRACKNKHILMGKFHPEHHCSHSGMGNIADDDDHFVCVDTECNLDTKPNYFAGGASPGYSDVDIVNAGGFPGPFVTSGAARAKSSRAAADQARKGCYLGNVSSIPRLLDPTLQVRKSFGALAASRCMLTDKVITATVLGFPDQRSALTFASMCDPQIDNKDSDIGDNDTPRFSDCSALVLKLSLDLHSANFCAPKLDDAVAEEARLTLNVATELKNQYHATCLSNQSSLRQYVLDSCTKADAASLHKWVGQSSNFSNSNDASDERVNGAQGLASFACRRAVHASCANVHEHSPKFCRQCFPFGAVSEEQCRDDAKCAENFQWKAQCNTQKIYSLCPRMCERCPSSVAQACSTSVASYFDRSQDLYGEGEWVSAKRKHDNWWSSTDASNLTTGPDPKYAAPEHNTRTHTGTSEFDYVIVGAGTAGCAVARRLSDEGYTVLLLERGIDWQREEDVWALTRKMSNTPYNWKAGSVTASLQSSNVSTGSFGRVHDIVQGSTLGGTSSVNGGVWSRPPPSDFANWPEGWDAKTVGEYYTQLENDLSLESPNVGKAAASEFLRAAERAKFPLADDSEGFGVEGLRGTKYTIKGGERLDSFSHYLKDILPRDGLEVRTGANVGKLRLEDAADCSVKLNRKDGKQTCKRAVAVEYTAHGQKHTLVAHAKREIILSAGFSESSKILLLSGIGNATEIGSNMKLDAHVDLPGVGKGLSASPRVGISFGGALLPPQRNPLLQTSYKAGAEWAHKRTGIENLNLHAVHGKMVSKQTKQGVLISLLTTAPMNLPTESVTTHCTLPRPNSRGQVTAPVDPDMKPFIHLNFLNDVDDVKALDDCVVRVLGIYSHLPTAGMDLMGWYNMTEPDRHEFIRQTVEYGWYAMGSNAMGHDDDEAAVVDNRLKVRGLSNLRVIDLSVVPDAVHAEPMATAYMIGEHGAALILGDAAPAAASAFSIEDSTSLAAAKLFGLACNVIILLWACWLVVRASVYTMQVRKYAAEHSRTAVDEAAVNTEDDASRNNYGEAASVPDLHPAVFADDSGMRDAYSRMRRHTQAPPLKSSLRSTRSTIAPPQESVSRTRMSSVFQSVTEEEDAGPATEQITIKWKDVHLRVQRGGAKQQNSILGPIDGEFRRGTLNFIVGTSGAGKSTLMKILSMRSSFDNATLEGAVHYCTKDVTYTRPDHQVPDVLRSVAYIAQYELMDELPYILTVRESLCMFMELNSPFSNGAAVDYTKISNVLEAVGLAHVIDSEIQYLSGGQKKRLVIATRLLGNSAAIFMDEPTSGLDATTSLNLLAMLRGLADSGMMVCITIHQPRVEILELCDQLMVLALNGKKVFAGSYDELTSLAASMSGTDASSNALDVVLDKLTDNETAQGLADSTRAKDEREEAVVMESRVQQFPADKSSPPTVVSVVLMAYYCAMGAGSSTCLDTVTKLGQNLTTPFALMVVYLLVVSLTPQVLPAEAQADLGSVLGGSLIIVATTMTLFQVDYVTNIVGPESEFAKLLYSNGLAVRRVMATFWLVRTFFMTLFCIPAYAAYHFGVGFKAEAFAPVLLLYMYFINATCVVAMICELQFGSKNAPVCFGVYSALQILSSGLIVDLNSLPAYWRWMSDINPLRYYLQGLLRLEFEGSPLALGKCEPYFPEAACPSTADFLDSLGFRDTEIATCIWALIIVHAAVTALYVACYTEAWQYLTCCRQKPGNASASSESRASIGAANDDSNADAELGGLESVETVTPVPPPTAPQSALPRTRPSAAVPLPHSKRPSPTAGVSFAGPHVLVSQFTVEPSDLGVAEEPGVSLGFDTLDVDFDTMRQQTTSFPPSPGFSNVSEFDFLPSDVAIAESPDSTTGSTSMDKPPKSALKSSPSNARKSKMRPTQARSYEGSKGEIPSWHGQRRSSIARNHPRFTENAGTMMGMPQKSIASHGRQSSTVSGV